MILIIAQTFKTMAILKLLLSISKWVVILATTIRAIVLNENDSLVVLGSVFVTTNNFTNYGDITADTLNLSVAGDFDYSSDFQNNGNIEATNQYFTIRNGDFSNNTSLH